MKTSKTQLERLEHLERLVRRLKALILLASASAIGLVFLLKFAVASPSETRILHVRGIVIEDAKEKPRLLLGAPAPNVGRKRQDNVTGLVMLSDDGVDRLSLGSADYDQVNGILQHRVDRGIGFLLNDAKGNERGGFGFLESGHVTLGLDRADGHEGAFLTVNDEDEFAGLLVKDLQTCNVVSLGSSKAENTRLLMRDQACNDRVVLGIRNTSNPRLEVLDPNEKLLFDALEATKR